MQKFDSVEEYISSLGLVDTVLNIECEEYRNNVISNIGTLKEYLWKKHLLTLSEVERCALGKGEHVSQRMDFEKAEPYLNAFILDYKLEMINSCCLGNYHGVIVISVNLKKGISVLEGQKNLPIYYKGFEVKLHLMVS